MNPLNIPDLNLPRVVIIGGGFGGIDVCEIPGAAGGEYERHWVLFDLRRAYYYDRSGRVLHHR